MASVMISEVVKVKLTDLKEYPDNPRIGNVTVIAESLKENGQFRPLIVQKSTMQILGGNHTYKGAKKLRWKTIDVVFVDVDDDHARKIVLADNRTSDMATYDTEALMKVISELDTPDVGTGYSTADITALVTAIAEKNADAVQEVISDRPKISFGDSDTEDMDFSDRMDLRQKAMEDSPVLDDELRAIYEGDSPDALNELSQREKIHVEVQTHVEAMLENFFSSTNEWGVPDLRMDRIPEEFPEGLDTWAGPDTTPDDGTSHWILNWGSVSSKGIPWDRTVLGFYSHDAKWVSWHENTAYLCGKVFSLGVRNAIAPDNSVELGYPRFLHLRSMYNGAWLARVLQEIGIDVIPNIKMVDPISAKLAILGIPKGTPTLAIGLQSMTEEDMGKLGMHTLLKGVVQELQPANVMVYGGPPAERTLEKAKLPKGVNAIYVENYSAKRNKALKPWHEDRKKHDGAVKEARERKGIKPKQREEPVYDVDEE